MRYAMKNARVLLASLLLCVLVLSLLTIVPTLFSTPIGGTADSARLGAFTGPEGGAAQDDNVKASLDLAHTDLDAILADTGTDGVAIANDGITAAKIAANAIAASEIATNAIDADAIADDSIDAGALAANCITSSEIADNAIDEGAIAADAITTAELATGCISADEIADNAIDAGAIAANAITATKIAASAITASQLATDCITSDELAASALAEIRVEVAAALETAGNMSEIGDKVVADMDANSLLVNWTAARAAILSEIHLSAIGDKVVADMDANSLLVNWTAARAGYVDNLATDASLAVISGTVVDNVVAAMDANSLAYWNERTITKTVVGFTNPVDNLWDVAGGPILITSLVGIVTETVDANAATAQITCDADGSLTDTQFTNAFTWNDVAIGTVITFTGANPGVGTALITGGTEGSGNPQYPWVCKEGMIEMANSAANADGTVIWYMTWKPLTAGVTVSSQ